MLWSLMSISYLTAPSMTNSLIGFSAQSHFWLTVPFLAFPEGWTSGQGSYWTILSNMTLHTVSSSLRQVKICPLKHGRLKYTFNPLSLNNYSEYSFNVRCNEITKFATEESFFLIWRVHGIDNEKRDWYISQQKCVTSEKKKSKRNWGQSLG